MEYLEHHWNPEVANHFENETVRVVNIVQRNPYIGRYDEYFRCNLILVVKQISLLYDIKNNQVILLTFWNNYQKPIKRLSF
jgi:hypothetical protein